MNERQAIAKFINVQFGGGVEPELEQKIVNACKVVKLKKREILFNEGDKGNYIYFLSEGVIKLYRVTEDGKEVVIHFVYAGELFAEVVLKPDTPYPVTSTALEECVLVALNVRVLYDLMQSDREFMQRFTALLARRLKGLVSTIQDLTSRDVAGRFYDYLKETAEHKGTNTFRLPVAKRELALLLGTTPETLSRVIKKLSDEGRLTADGQMITLLN